jgi:hypothetical protein
VNTPRVKIAPAVVEMATDGSLGGKVRVGIGDLPPSMNPARYRTPVYGRHPATGEEILIGHADTDPGLGPLEMIDEATIGRRRR